ncbi:MAG: molybdopterin dinucleotide binding domain-containing protein [bacterium]|nr:molybdopterin dinucleotide binding domain-containing protein [bacterium]
MGENPMMSDPNLNHVEEALEKLEFLVVQDIFTTETTKFADVVLPVKATLEKDGTFTSTERRVQPIRPVLEPHSNIKEDWVVIRDVAKKMGYEMKYENVWDILREVNKLTPIYAGITPERIDEGLQWPCKGPDLPGTAFLHKDGNFSRGKGLFSAIEFKEPAELPDKEYPMILSTGRILTQYHTGTMSRKNFVLNYFSPEGYVEINPEDAKELKIKDKEMVIVKSRRGEIKTKVKISEKVSKGLVFIPFHFCEAPANILTNDALDPVAKIPEFKVAACKVIKP